MVVLLDKRIQPTGLPLTPVNYEPRKQGTGNGKVNPAAEQAYRAPNRKTAHCELFTMIWRSDVIKSHWLIIKPLRGNFVYITLGTSGYERKHLK